MAAIPYFPRGTTYLPPGSPRDTGEPYPDYDPGNADIGLVDYVQAYPFYQVNQVYFQLWSADRNTLRTNLFGENSPDQPFPDNPPNGTTAALTRVELGNTDGLLQPYQYVLAVNQNLQYSIKEIFNNYIDSVADLYDDIAYDLNNNDAVEDPVGYITFTIGSAGTIANGLVATATAMVTTYSNFLTTTVNGLKSGTIDPTVVTVNNLVNSNAGFVLALIAGYQTQINQQIASLQAQAAAIQAQVNALIATYGPLVTEQLANLMSQAAAVQALALAQAGMVSAMVMAQAAIIIEIVTQQVTQIQNQVSDRALYYGNLTTPITVTSATDIIQIPAGALRVFMD